jgi:hypothetical protein
MKSLVILIHAFIGWGMCGMIMAIGMKVTSIDNALIIHAIGAPIIFVIISIIYFKKFGFTKPLQTGIIFVIFIILMDFFVVAMLIEKNFDMFKSLLFAYPVRFERLPPGKMFFSDQFIQT